MRRYVLSLNIHNGILLIYIKTVFLQLQNNNYNIQYLLLIIIRN